MGHEVIVYKKRGEDMYSEEWWTQPDKTLKRVSRPDASGARAIKTPVQSDMRRNIRPDSRPRLHSVHTYSTQRFTWSYLGRFHKTLNSLNEQLT